MPLVRPNYKDAGLEKKEITAGRYAVQIVEVSESEKLDKNGNNALVVKMSVIDSKIPEMNGKKISRWLPLGGAGAKVLYRFMKCVNEAYDGGPFLSESLIGKTLEIDVVMETNPKDGKQWAKVDRVYPYLQPGSVGNNFHSNVDEKDVPDFDDFDKN